MQLHATTHNYMQLHATTHNYTQLHATTRNYTQLHTTTLKDAIDTSYCPYDFSTSFEARLYMNCFPQPPTTNDLPVNSFKIP